MNITPANPCLLQPRFGAVRPHRNEDFNNLKADEVAFTIPSPLVSGQQRFYVADGQDGVELKAAKDEIGRYAAPKYRGFESLENLEGYLSYHDYERDYSVALIKNAAAIKHYEALCLEKALLAEQS